MNSAFLRNQRRLPVADTPDLFAANPLPDGFRYIPDVLSVAEEKSLVERFEKLPLKPFEFHGYLANRRIYSFGHKYIFAGQESRSDVSPEMNMDDVVAQSKQKGDHLNGASWIVHAVGIGAPKTSKIDHRAGDIAGSQELANGNQITLDTAVGRGIRSELKDPHESLS